MLKKFIIATTAILTIMSSHSMAYAQEKPVASSEKSTMNVSAPIPGSEMAMSPVKEPTPEELEKKAEEAAFDAALKSMLPMDKGQIYEFKKRLDDSQKVFSAPVGPPPKAVFRSIEVSLQPGEAAPSIRLAAGNVSTVTFSDLTGSPWAIESFGVGNSSAFHAQIAGAEKKTNVIAITPLTTYGGSNLMVKLVGHPVPVIMTLKTGEKEVDYRLDTKVLKRGPMTESNIVINDTLQSTGDSVMLAFLDGLPPKNAKKVKTSSPEIEAYLFEDMMFVRTTMTMLSPAYVGKSTNVSGVNVFVLPETPVLMFSHEGRMKTISVEG